MQTLHNNYNCGTFTFPPSAGKLLPKSNFEKPYITLDSSAAGMAYRQSLYLVRVLEQMRGGDEALREIIKNAQAGTIAQDEILARTYNRATEQWNNKEQPH